MIQNLPWLVAPTTQDRERLTQSGALTGGQLVAALRGLVNRAWNEGELSSIGRRLRRGLAAGVTDCAEAAQATGCTSVSLLIISTNTVNHLLDALCASALRAGILLHCQTVEYQEPESWLAIQRERLEADPPDATLLALDRSDLQLRHCPLGDPAAAVACIQAALDRLRRMAEQLLAITGRPVILQTLAAQASDPQLSADAWLEGSARRLLAEFNLKLPVMARELSCIVFDVAAIANLVGLTQWSAGRYWYLAKLPFAPTCVPLYAHRLVQLLAAMRGKAKRVLVLDLDNTLWGGLIGDDGISGIELGTGSARGEVFLALQRLALQYKDRGVVLCVASKNAEDVAREVFRSHPEMLIRESDVALFQINWQDKPSNISAMAEALELGLDTFVFIDDSPAERKQMRDTLPQIETPELPNDPSAWLEIIQAAGYFEQLSFSAEDRARTDYYKGNALRSIHAKKIGNHEEFLKSLGMTITVEPFNALGRQRIAQLIAKSNQFNLTTRRYSEAEVASLETDPGAETLQVRLQDMFGDNGMISIVICRKHGGVWEIDTWIMSCRVLGRGIEQALLAILVNRARAAGARELQGVYIPTPKNGLVRDHYARLGFARIEEAAAGKTTWTLLVDDFVPVNALIDVRERVAADA
jgi:FkbH-like protein